VGQNTYGQTNISATATNIVAIRAGTQHSVGLRANGTVVGWGQNNASQLNVPIAATNVIGIAAGSGFSAALRTDGTVIQWVPA